MGTHVRRATREQRGAVLVFFALFAPVAVLFLSFVVDVGDWFDHARHLQLQADAGALAAAQGFQPCNDTTIYSAAGQYSGAASVTTPTGETVTATSPLYNQQLGGTTQANIHELINSPTYYEQPSPVDSTVKPTNPCAAEMVDVKVTETNLPWYLRMLSLGAPSAHAHARVEILERTTSTGSLPVAVNDLNPKSIEAYFVDEATGEQLSAGGKPAAVALQRVGPSGGLQEWGSSEPYGLEVAKPGIGVRVAISGRSNLTGSMSADCGRSLVICYDLSSSKVGILHIQGWSGNGSGSPTSPIAREVTLSRGACSDGYFSSTATTCEVGVQAHVDVGATPNPPGLTVSAELAGKQFALTYNTSGTLSGQWTGAVTLAPGSGSNQVNLQVKCTAKVTPSCEKTKTTKIEGVQRSYAAGSNSGPIQAAFLTQGGVPGADSFRVCESGNEGEACTHKLAVTIDISGNLQDAQSVSDPLYEMRLSETGSQNQSVECAPVQGSPTYANGLASGCAGPYGINPTLTCPDSNTPIDCVRPATGEKINQIGKGMNLRILGSEKPETCTSPNHWKEFTFTNGVPDVSPSDPRVVTVFITPYGSFGGSGKSTEFPIADFATFYVTGWQGSKGEGFSNPCQGNGDDTAKESTIVGHFIKYVETLAPTGGGGSTCEIDSLNECVAVLTN